MTRRSGKKDKSDEWTKLAVRRSALTAFGGELHVLDCCAGGRRLWTKLAGEFTLTSYLSLDVKEKAGNVRVNSIRWLREGPLAANVVDIDTYGEPWRHWNALLASEWRHDRLLCFVTIGRGMQGLSRCSFDVLDALGIPRGWLEMIPPPGQKLLSFAVSYCLTRSCGDAILIREIRCANSKGSHGTIYLGVILERGKGDASDL